MVFSNLEFGKIRTSVDEKGEPLFCLADLCRILELDINNTVRRLDDGVCSKHPISDSIGRVQMTNFVNEDGLYDVILDSRKPEARRFRKWVTSEVLTSIRKTGGYGSRQYQDLSPLEHAILAIDGLFSENQALIRKNEILRERLKAVSTKQHKFRAQIAKSEKEQRLLLEAPTHYAAFLEQTDLLDEPMKRVPLQTIWHAFQSYCLAMKISNTFNRRNFASFMSEQPLGKVKTNKGICFFKP